MIFNVKFVMMQSCSKVETLGCTMHIKCIDIQMITKMYMWKYHRKYDSPSVGCKIWSSQISLWKFVLFYVQRFSYEYTKYQFHQEQNSKVCITNWTANRHVHLWNKKIVWWR